MYYTVCCRVATTEGLENNRSVIMRPSLFKKRNSWHSGHKFKYEDRMKYEQMQKWN